MADVGDNYKAHVEALLTPVKGEMERLRTEMERLRTGETAPSEVAMADTELRCAAAPRHRWRIGRYQLAFDHGRWDLNDGCKGVGNHRTPIGAWFALRRWQRTPSRPAG